jgi:hypothetical protein
MPTGLGLTPLNASVRNKAMHASGTPSNEVERPLPAA